MAPAACTLSGPTGRVASCRNAVDFGLGVAAPRPARWHRFPSRPTSTRFPWCPSSSTSPVISRGSPRTSSAAGVAWLASLVPPLPPQEATRRPREGTSLRMRRSHPAGQDKEGGRRRVGATRERLAQDRWKVIGRPARTPKRLWRDGPVAPLVIARREVGARAEAAGHRTGDFRHRWTG